MAKSTLTLSIPVKDGKLQPNEWALHTIAQYLAGKTSVTVRFSGPKRSLRQNKFLWGVAYQLIADHTGMSCEDIHDWCKSEFLPRRFITLGGKEKEIRKSSADLDTREFGEFLERIRVWAGTDLGVVIPLPNE